MGQLERNLTPDGSTDYSTMGKDISDLIDELNRQADQLDSFDKGIRIIARGVASLVPSGGAYTPQTISLNPGLATSFLCFVQRSDNTGSLFTTPYFDVVSGSPYLGIDLVASAYVQQNSITFTAQTTLATPPTLNFYYYMVQQPANPTVS